MSHTPKITILFLTADPSDASRLRLGEEFRDVQEKLQLARMRELFSLSIRMSVRPADITQAIFDTEPEIVHFSGHGTSTGALCFEDRVGKVKTVQPEALASLFELIADQVHCVVLNACYSEIQATAIAEHVTYVIGMKEEIGDEAAIAFAVGFYKALGAGRSIEDAYNFGVVELKLLGIPEHLTPVLVRKDAVRQCSDRLTNLRSRIASDAWSGILENTYRWLVADQISESGGWGKSQYSIMEEATGKGMSPLEKEEGGVISTFIALRALMNYEQSPYVFRAREYSRKALAYLLRRQTHTGGFGRFVESRSGLEIHPSIRHTAFAVSCLVDLNGPPGSILRGLSFLKDNWNLDHILDDAAPCLAAAGVKYAVDRLMSTQTLSTMFTEEEQRELHLAQWPEAKQILIRQLVEMSRLSPLNPFWPPYGNRELLIYETALTTIDLVSSPLPLILAPTVIDMLSSMLESATSAGIPYNPAMDTPDIGISAYLLSLVMRPGFLESLGNDGVAKKLVGLSERLEQFVRDNCDNERYRHYTHCDTIASLLLLR